MIHSEQPRFCEPLYGYRQFRILKGNLEALVAAIPRDSYASGMLLVQEIGDLIFSLPKKLWIQHFPFPAVDIEQAQYSDMLLTCHPEQYVLPWLKEKHIFPKAQGEILVARLPGTFKFMGLPFACDDVLVAFPRLPHWPADILVERRGAQICVMAA